MMVKVKMKQYIESSEIGVGDVGRIEGQEILPANCFLSYTMRLKNNYRTSPLNRLACETMRTDYVSDAHSKDKDVKMDL